MLKTEEATGDRIVVRCKVEACRNWDLHDTGDLAAAELAFLRWGWQQLIDGNWICPTCLLLGNVHTPPPESRVC